MASPLQNPLVVTGLLIGGICYGLYNFVPPDWLERLEGQPTRATIPAPLQVVAPNSLSSENRFFIARPPGMPKEDSVMMQKGEFKWQIFHETPKLGISKEPTPLPATWKLTAVYLDENQNPPVRAAVVAGDILRVGSKKGGFVVEEITEESVTFSHPTGKQTLSFSKDTQDKNKAKK